MPAPFGPSTATRSPYQISASNTSVRPCSDSPSIMSALRPVRPPLRRTSTRWSCTSSGGLVRSSKCRRRVSAAFSLGANPSEILARCRITPHELDQAGPLVLPLRGVTGEAVVPGVPGLVVGGEAAAVGPRALGLDGDDLGGDAGQQLAIVADEEDGLGAAAQLVLQPALARDVQEVVGLVQEQDGGVAAEQRLERQALLLAARARGHRPGADGLVGLAQHLGGDRVPEDLELVAADLGPVADGLGVGDGGAGVVGLGEVVGLGLGQAGVDPQRGERSEGRQQLVDRRAVADRADELGHDRHAAVHGDGAVGSGQLAADEAQQGGLPGAVDADEGDVVTVADAERRVLEEGVAAGPGPAQVADLE